MKFVLVKLFIVELQIIKRNFFLAEIVVIVRLKND